MYRDTEGHTWIKRRKTGSAQDVTQTTSGAAESASHSEVTDASSPDLEPALLSIDPTSQAQEDDNNPTEQDPESLIDPELGEDGYAGVVEGDVEEDTDSEYESDSETDSELPNPQANKSLKFADMFHWLLILIFLWQISHNISALAISGMLQLMSKVFSAIEIILSPGPAVVGLSAFPATVYLAYKYLKIDPESLFVRHVMCPKCYSLYNYNDTLKSNEDGSLPVKKCTRVAFPLHPHQNRRLACNTPLVKPINLSSGSRKLYALHCYISKSLKDALQRILLRNGMHVKLEAWRNRSIPEGYYADVYEGRVWKSFKDDLFKQKRSLGLMINIDWFQPYKHCTDSLGALYLVIMNLPRKERYKRENVILSGLIPSLDAEPSSLNTFLSPLVNELQDLWVGIRLNTSESPRFKVLVRAALLCAACDIPAARRLCGFKGHNANRGCSKCFKLFPGPVTNKDYSGFDRDTWPTRNLTEHRTFSKKIQNATTLVAKNKLETNYGIYYSILSELSYFDPIKHCIIDPMHNLFLGTAKRFFKKILIAKGLLDNEQLKVIQARVNSVSVPSTVGRIPKKIASAFSGFTAEQWMNWTLVYSLYALRGVLPEQHYHCWEAFVLACRLLSCPILSDATIKRADLLLLHFCRKVEHLYGRNEITPNMHLHCHLSGCMEDYGPIFGFWLFSFERYNGMLGKFPNNQKNIEVQLMKKFETEMQLYDLPLPESLKELFFPVLKDVTGDLHNVWEPDTDFELYHLSIADFQQANVMSLFRCKWSVPSRWTVHMLTICEQVPFSQSLRHVFPVPRFIPDFDSLSKTVRCYKRIEFGKEVFTVYNNSRYGRHSFILANWAGKDGDIDHKYGLRPGRVQKIYVYKLLAGDGENYVIPLCKVQWYKEHSKKNMFRRGFGFVFKRQF